MKLDCLVPGASANRCRQRVQQLFFSAKNPRGWSPDHTLTWNQYKDHNEYSGIFANIKNIFIEKTAIFLGLLCVSCASVPIGKAPSIAHIHIGHAITAWPQAPAKEGLLVLAELNSVAAKANSFILSQSSRDGELEKAKSILKELADIIDPAYFDPTRKREYGLRRAAAEAISHLNWAADNTDASDNVKRTVIQTTIKAGPLIDKADELSAYIEAGLQASSREEMQVIAEEIDRVIKQISGDTGNPQNYGLFEFRKDIESMIAREDPPYTIVPRWYLMNLKKKNDGTWGFLKPDDPNEDSGYSGA